jgi:hypothetical protein
MNTLTYDDLFAYRLQLLEQTTDEYVVINRLKIKLQENGVLDNELNEYVYNFYLIYDIPITIREIENVPIQSPFSEFVTQEYDDNLHESEDDEYHHILIDMGTSVENLSNLLNFLQNVINEASQQPMGDVTVTTDKNSLDKIQTFKITKDMNERCTICMDDMKEGDEYYNLTCKHIFHIDCIKEYLLNYNHMCPLCKKEIGDKKINI